jgi:hypothetical protein
VAHDVAHETALVDAFILPSKRERIRELLSKPKRRRSVLESLYHQAPLDPDCMRRIPPAEQSRARIEALLRAIGAPNLCYVISTDAGLDGMSLPLHAALEQVVGRGEGTILCCIPGRLGYFEAEDAGERYVLERRVGPTKRRG